MLINKTYKHNSCTQPVWWNAECQQSKSAKYEKMSKLRKVWQWTRQSRLHTTGPKWLQKLYKPRKKIYMIFVLRLSDCQKMNGFKTKYKLYSCSFIRKGYTGS